MVLIIGQSPSPDTLTPFDGRSGARLADLCGLSHAAFLARFQRTNLIAHYPGRRINGDNFPLAAAKCCALAMEPGLVGERVVIVGLQVARAFRVPTEPLFAWRWVEGAGYLAAVSPHPSGRNRWWNEAANVEAARRFWSGLARTLHDGAGPVGREHLRAVERCWVAQGVRG
jgi:uracil-DNA glycosylase